MKIKILSVCTLFFMILVFGCRNSKKPEGLIYDEIVLSSYQMQIFNGDTKKEVAEKLKEYDKPYETIKFNCGFLYIPVTILSIKKDGSVAFYKRPSIKNSGTGYSQTTLTNNTVSYSNEILLNINNRKIDTLYDGKREPGLSICRDFGFTRYYLSVRKGSDTVQTAIYSVDNIPAEVKRLVEYLEYLQGVLVFTPARNIGVLDSTSKCIFNFEIKTSYPEYKYRPVLKWPGR